MCDVNCTPVVWASNSPAGLVWLQLFVYESFVMIGLLCIVDVRLMAKGTTLHCCGEEKKATGDCVFAKASTTALQFIEDMNVVFSSRPVLTEIPTSCRHVFASTASVLDVGMHYFYVSSHLDTAELLMVERCLCQDRPTAHCTQ